MFTSSPAGADFDGAIDALPAHTAQIREAYAKVGRDAHGWKQHDASDRILGFYDYGPDLDFFAEHVQPLLAERGLRI